jgi:hypothetical protein
VLLRRRLAAVIGPHGPGGRRTGRIALAGLLAVGAGAGAKYLLGFSLVPGVLASMLGPTPVAWLLDPLAAVATAALFGVAYLAAAAALGVGMGLRFRAAHPI